MSTTIILTIRRQISYEEGAKLASENGVEFMEVSAKTGNNVDQVKLPWELVKVFTSTA